MLGCARAWVYDRLFSHLPILSVDTYYMCVGGLSGFDGLLAMSRRGATLRRLVFYDRDPQALAYARLIHVLIGFSMNRDALLMSLFGRDPSLQQSPLSKHSMFSYIETEVDTAHIARIRRRLPTTLRPLYDTVVTSTAHGVDHSADGMELPQRRVWPCWGLRRSFWPFKAKGLYGGGNETFHYNELGWLADDESYNRLRGILFGKGASIVEFELLDLNAFKLGPLSRDCEGHVLFISNADQSRKFLHSSRREFEMHLGRQCRSLLLISTMEISMLYSPDGSHTHVESLAERSQADEAASKDLGAWSEEDEGALKRARRVECLRMLESADESRMWGSHFDRVGDCAWFMNKVLERIHD